MGTNFNIKYTNNVKCLTTCMYLVSQKYKCFYFVSKQ